MFRTQNKIVVLFSNRVNLLKSRHPFLNSVVMIGTRFFVLHFIKIDQKDISHDLTRLIKRGSFVKYLRVRRCVRIIVFAVRNAPTLRRRVGENTLWFPCDLKRCLK